MTTTKKTAKTMAKTTASKTASKTAGKSTSEAPAKKTAARKTAAKKAPAKKTGAPRAEGRPRTSGSQVAARAASQLLELTGREAEGITGLERTDDGWTVQVEVVEVRRIPDTTDVLALYEVTTDEKGDLEGYHRLRRYVRGTPGEDAR